MGDCLGFLVGKSSTNEFSFHVEGDARKFLYIQAHHQEGYDVLALIVDIEKNQELTRAHCQVIGYRASNGMLKTLRVPLEPDCKIFAADDAFVQQVLGLEKTKHSAYIGTLEGRDGLSVYFDLNKLLIIYYITLIMIISITFYLKKKKII